MNRMLLSFVITFLSGFSTMIGSLVLFININNKNKMISTCLLFSSCVMFYISVFDLIPASFNYINKIYCFIPSVLLVVIYALLGGILVYYLDRLSNCDNKLYKLGLITMITIIIHNIPEGIITFITTSKDLSIGIPLAFSIALHNIPEGIAISIPLYYGKGNKKKAFFYTFIASISEPLGAFIGYIFFNNINNYMFSMILSFTSGIMIYLAFFELLKEGIKCKKKKDA